MRACRVVYIQGTAHILQTVHFTAHILQTVHFSASRNDIFFFLFVLLWNVHVRFYFEKKIRDNSIMHTCIKYTSELCQKKRLHLDTRATNRFRVNVAKPNSSFWKHKQTVLLVKLEWLIKAHSYSILTITTK